MNLFSQNTLHLVTPTGPYRLLFKGTKILFSVSIEDIACKTVKRMTNCSLFSDWNRNFRIRIGLAEMITSYKINIQHILFL